MYCQLVSVMKLVDFCVLVVECKDFTCWNGGTCKIMNGELDCECPLGYSGFQCRDREYKWAILRFQECVLA